MYKSVAEVRAGIEPSDRRPVVWRRGSSRPSTSSPDSRGARRAGPSLDAWHADVGAALDAEVDLRAGRDLQSQGYRASAELVRRLLHQMGYTLQAPAKAERGTAHPDRDGQFAYINKLVDAIGSKPASRSSAWTPRRRS